MEKAQFQVGGRALAYVLDDEERVGVLLSRMLASFGVTARNFVDARAFLRQVGVLAPELIVLDLMLGQSDGVEVIRSLAELDYRGKVLLISGRDQSTLAEIEQIGAARGLAMLPSLKKPFRVKDLEQTLARQGKANATPPKADPQRAGAAAIDLDEALRCGWVELWYQPKVSLDTFRIRGAEGLIRVRHPEYGVLSPARFLPPSGDPIYETLTHHVVTRAIADGRWLAERGLSLELSVNVPLSALLSRSLIASIIGGIPTDRAFPGLILEITEDEALRESETLREVAAQLSLYGIRLSIDDFGSAYSSLAHLRDLRCSELKLDRNFVVGCSTDTANRALCIAAAQLARVFGLSSCAEGVDDIDDLQTLVEIGFETAQGFIFAEAMERDRLPAWEPPAVSVSALPGPGGKARTIFEASKDNAPRAIARLTRLEHARRLLSGGEAATIEAAARACGFVNLKTFESEYLRAFKEHPSRAIERRAGRAPGARERSAL